MNELNQLIDLAQSGMSDTVRGSNFESYQEASNFETYIMSKNMVDRPTAKDQLEKIRTAGRLTDLRAQMKKDRNYNGAGLGTGTLKEGSRTESVGQFDLIATRLTANIASPLPIAFLSPEMLESAYGSVMQLPSGVTLAIEGGARDGYPTKFRFTFTSGASVDIIEVETGDSALAYPSFMSACQTDKFRASNIRYIAPDETAASLAQLKNSIQFFTATTFGTTTSKKLATSAFRDPKNFVKNILDIEGSYAFDKERGFYTNINAVAGMSITLSMFLEKLFRDTVDGF